MESIKYREGYKYQLAETYSLQTSIIQVSRIETEFIDLDETGRLTIRGAYAWDGPSGPMIDTPNAMRGSLVHDPLYQLMRMGLLDRSYRHPADEEFRRICLEDGMSKFRAWYSFEGVDHFAAGAASADARKKIITAP